MSEGGGDAGSAGGGGGGGGGNRTPPTTDTQREPINLKSNEAESDRESSTGTPESGGSRPQLTVNPALQRLAAQSPSSRSHDTSPHHNHINGTMASMFQNLQNLASMQQNLPQLSQQMSQLAANLQGLTSLATNNLNSPLNLSVTGSGVSSPGPVSNNANSMISTSLSQSMPQFILASGQLIQGIQGAQLLIPTSQGIATQTILTIPVTNTNNDQMVNMALNNGQCLPNTIANMAIPQQHLITQQANSLRNVLNPTSNAALTNALLNPTLPNFLNGSAQELLQALQPNMQQNNTLLQTVPQNLQGRRSSSPRMDHHQGRHYKERDREYSSPYSRERESNSGQSIAAAAAALSSINRLAATNGEITITTTHGGGSSTASSVGGNGGSSRMTSPHPVKLSPGSMKMSPSENDDSELLADSPNQPTINQATSNVVDGINLDDIKEFAKAFKLRRLGLGLTQTQVGQALSVTEGPAYSQSAICSALASQMLAAQLSSQQQNIFEKLDITPKSAQKIKPVLERWMMEAEERYASGQNHLTDFMGMEPSKKRKRRTSFTPQALELLNAHFERNTHPSGTEITGLAHQLGYEREVIRIWFCNKRQALKNTVRMMSKGMV